MLCTVVSDNPPAPNLDRSFSSGRWTRNPIGTGHFRAAALAGVLTSPAGWKTSHSLKNVDVCDQFQELLRQMH